MANPKYKMSRSRTRKRRSHDRIIPPSLSECPNCKEMKMPHRLCPACGHYGDRAVIDLDEAKKKAAG